MIRLVWLELTPFYVCFFIYTVIYLSILRCFAGPGECGFLVEISVFLFFFRLRGKIGLGSKSESGHHEAVKGITLIAGF